MKTGKVLHFLPRVSVTFTPVVEESRELLHTCECEEQKSRHGNITQVTTGWQERRGSEASLKHVAWCYCIVWASRSKSKAYSCDIQQYRIHSPRWWPDCLMSIFSLSRRGRSQKLGRCAKR